MHERLLLFAIFIIGNFVYQLDCWVNLVFLPVKLFCIYFIVLLSSRRSYSMLSALTFLANRSVSTVPVSRPQSHGPSDNLNARGEHTVDPGARTQCSIRTAKIVSESLRPGASNCELLGVANYMVFRFAERFDKVSPKAKMKYKFKKSENLSVDLR